MQGIDLTRTVFVQPTWSPNSERVKEEPPFMLRGDPDAMSEDELETEDVINKGELNQARRYDYYRDIVHVSTLTPCPGGIRGTAYHMIVNPKAASTQPERITHPTGIRRRDAMSHCYLQYFADEAQLLAKFWAGIGPATCTQWVAGWNILHGVWPMMIGKALQYRIPVPEHFRADPLRRFQDLNVLSVDTIYTQGVYYKARPLPQLADLIEWWGIPTDDNLPPMTRKQISELTPELWLRYGCRTVEKYLHGMIDIVEYYYGAGPWQNVSPVVDLSARGPMPT